MCPDHRHRPRPSRVAGGRHRNRRQLLIASGGDPERLALEAAFAHLCAAAPVPASSGRTDRHRLNRTGDRQANRTLHAIVVVRMRHKHRTRDHVVRRTVKGFKTTEVTRCLKCFAVRETYRHLTSASGRSSTASPAT
ncbi:transposase [Actinospica robiniae]|uniref:transposase n=1 Tax=Actinospica robiniae TaxID=304901 RepID=UPI000686C8AD